MSRYKFTQISQVSASHAVFRGATINDQGTVIFEGFGNEAYPPSGIFASKGEENATVVDGSPFTHIFFSSNINNNNTKSFIGVFYSPDFVESYRGVFVKKNGEVSTIVDSNSEFGYFSHAKMNNKGTIVFNALLDTAESGIFVSKDGKVTNIASSSDRFSNFNVGFRTVGTDGPASAFSVPSINDADTVAFHATLDTGATGIFLGRGKGTITVADSTGRFRSFSSPSINNNGTVAFLAQLNDGKHGIFKKRRDQEIETFVDDSSPFSFFQSNPALNDQGQIAFLAYLDAGGGSGIYTGKNPNTNKVIAVGDPLAGSKVVDLIIGGNSLNNAGQVTFEAILENGSIAVFRADPVTQSHSGTLSLVSVSIFAMVGLCWRKWHNSVGK
ncbi:choice-of-anchor tandem repeat NxxGxxAF-containing protein [Gloeocapsopsis sp. IPPAS B-1203]|uniref:DUF7453 family protein n=1 Tax=Gloeocapsopsis sp. IPPAS B-1203 TaxID=2049454 RepID=UPI000C1A21A6|nr:choice-of-anchor tandem repeat NxxGxxAF-containing protein [Gloeocapsopsis sp. IPPAS B-1203]PIG92427.1 hypothetical protein CSQ79_15140 [Gloeocapsopsis sp. IPPAS B-1203]